MRQMIGMSLPQPSVVNITVIFTHVLLQCFGFGALDGFASKSWWQRKELC